MEYKYILEKYSSKSKKTCPSCGRAKCFTRYIDTESGQYVDENVGICDHKNSCKYHLPPKEFIKPLMTLETLKTLDLFKKERSKERKKPFVR